MIEKDGGASRRVFGAFFLALTIGAGIGCGGSSGSGAAPLQPGGDGGGNDPTGARGIYPAFADDDGNGINDFVEASTHDSGASSRMMGPGMGPGVGPGNGPGWPSGSVSPGAWAPAGHAFVDLNGDGICDYAQNGSGTWHGPGFVDHDGDGFPDAWQTGTPSYGMNGGMMFADRNGNGINDYVEQPWHQGYGHDFMDQNHDGVCDYAQTGGANSWHGPNFADQDHNGTCDWWQQGQPGWWYQGPGGWCPGW